MPVLPADLTTDVVLRDGSTVFLRPLADGDADALLNLAAELPAGTLYTRFFATPRSPAIEIASLLAASADRQFALVAESAGQLVGVACYTRNDTARHAEVTLAVAVRFQGRGLGTLLLEAIARAAYAHGIRVFDAFVLADNTRMMKVFVDSGFAVTEQPHAGVHHVMLALEPTLTQHHETAARAQTAAAASMRAFFEPRSIVVVGASHERGKIGSELLHNILDGGYTGTLAVVHPSASSIQGVTAYQALSDVPGPIDLAIVSVPADGVGHVVEESLGKGVRAVVVISAGFSETGAAGRAHEVALVQAVRGAGVRMVGPNCLGLINTHPDVRLNATFSPVAAPRGHVAMSTQSGALGLAILDYARKLHIGFSTFISVGNKADVSSNDLLQYWAEDPDTHVIVLYVESFGNPRTFGEIARHVGRIKPIVAVKAGRSAVGARAASSHTGALAASDAIVDALFRQSGVIRTATIEELFDVAMLLANQPVPAGPRVAILTNAGGPGILAADACEAQGLDLPPLSDATTDALRSFLPAAAAIGNPVDIIASASADQFGRALDVLLADPVIDSVLVIFIPPMVTKGADVAREIERMARKTATKPVLAVFMSADPAPNVLGSVPSFTFPESAALALARACQYGAWRRQPEGTVREFPDFDRPAARMVVEQVLARGGGWASIEQSHALLRACGIPVVATVPVASEEDAVQASARLGFPVALKATGTRLIHKTELDAVRLGLSDAAAVRAAWRDFSGRLPDLMTGAIVQPMVNAGVEMLVGIVNDETFGPVLACASGGQLTEVVGDSQFRLFPVTDRDAQAMIDALKVARLLRGYRGRPPADESALREALQRLSALAGACPEIQELDINPLAVETHGAVALDVRVRIEPLRAKPVSRRVMY